MRAACQSSAARPRLPVPLSLLPLPMLSPQARPFRPAHWLGAFGDGEGGAPLVSWWRREFERSARPRSLGFPPDPLRPAPACSRQPAGLEPAVIRTRPLGREPRFEKGGHTQLFF